MKKLIILIAIVCYWLNLSAQQQSPYTKQWEEIDSLIVLKDLPKSALEKVNILYADAKAKHLQDEVIKTLLYRLSLEKKVKDDDINTRFSMLTKELQSTDDAISKAILSTILANEI